MAFGGYLRETPVPASFASYQPPHSAAPCAAPNGEAGTKQMKREQASLSDIPRTPSLAQGLGEQATPSTFLGSSHLVAEGSRSRCKRSTNLLTLARNRTAQAPYYAGLSLT